MIIKIEAFKLSDYKKDCTLKKSATQDFGRLFADCEPSKESEKDLFFKETAKRIKELYTGFESPYVLTHIKAINKLTGEPVKIYQTVNQFSTSPTTLLKLLTDN